MANPNALLKIGRVVVYSGPRPDLHGRIGRVQGNIDHGAFVTVRFSIPGNAEDVYRLKRCNIVALHKDGLGHV